MWTKVETVLGLLWLVRAVWRLTRAPLRHDGTQVAWAKLVYKGFNARANRNLLMDEETGW